MDQKHNINQSQQLAVTPGPAPDDLITVAELMQNLGKYKPDCKVLVQFAENLAVIPILDLSHGILEVDDNGVEKFETSIVSILVGEEIDDDSEEEEPEPVPAPVSKAKPRAAKKTAKEAPKPASSGVTNAPKSRATKKKVQAEKEQVVTAAPSTNQVPEAIFD
ncbi:MAG: hypothetical protein ACYC3F_16695 [Gemmatimonadaceae bacterium]